MIIESSLNIVKFKKIELTYFSKSVVLCFTDLRKTDQFLVYYLNKETE